MRTPHLWCSVQGTKIQAAFLLALASTGLLLVPIELITVSALCSPTPLGRAHEVRSLAIPTIVSIHLDSTLLVK